LSIWVRFQRHGHGVLAVAYFVVITSAPVVGHRHVAT